MKKFRSLSYSACICLLLVLIVSILLTACSTPATSSPAPAPATSQPAPAPIQVIELKLSHHMPPVAPAAKALEEYAKKIEANTNGRVKVTIYPTESLVKGREALPSTAAGVCDICYVALMYESSRLSLNNIVGLSSLPIPTDARGVAIWDKLWEKYPQMLKEFEGVKPMAHAVSLSVSIHTKKLVKVPDDVKGMKISGMGDSIKILQAAGAAPVSMGSNDWYMSLEKGVIEGIMAPIGVLTDRGVEVLVPNHIDLGTGQGGNMIIFNLNRWNSLPKDIQDAIEGLNSWAADAIMKANDQVQTEGWQKCAGQSIYKPTAEEAKLWLACCEPAAEDWLKANESKGPSREMYEYAKKLIAETK